MKRRLIVIAFLSMLVTAASAEDACKKCVIFIWPEVNLVGADCVVPENGQWGSHSCRPWVNENSSGALLGCDDDLDICYYLEVPGDRP